MHDVLPSLPDDQFTTFLRIYHACYAYCVGSLNGVETKTDNYHTAMSGKVVTSRRSSTESQTDISTSSQIRNIYI